MVKTELNLWVKCESCKSAIFAKTFEENLKVCEKCGFHHKLGAFERIASLLEEGSFTPWDTELYSLNPLNFPDDYMVKLKADQEKTGLKDAVLTGKGKLGGYTVALAIMDFSFRGGSMGSVVGELVVRMFKRAAREKLPALIFTASGGARMQEGMLSLMQMPKTLVGVLEFEKSKMPYIVVLTNPTTAGVAASFASVADLILAEPGAIIGFSGRRVIEQTIRQKLPPDFQSSEFYLNKGFIDQVVDRRNLKRALSQLLSFYHPE